MIDDLIRRSDAIALASGGCHPANLAEELAKLPSAQPEPSQIARDIATIIENEQDMRVIAALGDSNTPNTLNALEALERILNYCEEIDLHLPEAERSGYKMLPDYETVRKVLTERNHGSWIDLHLQGDSRFMCSVCKWKEHVPTCMGKPTVWEYCPSCGARMDGDA